MSFPGEPAAPGTPLFGLPAVSISCRRCGRLVDAGAASCPRCGYSLQPDAPGGARSPAPSDGDEPLTGVLIADRGRATSMPPAAAPPPPAAPEPERPQAPATQAGGLPMPVLPPPRTSARRSPVMLVALGLVVTGVLWLGVSTFIERSTPRTATPAAAGVSPTVVTGPRPVKNSTVDGVASSTGKAEGSVTYGIDNTLDDRPTTAWSSRGKGVGATLTYTFEQPVDLRGITVRNGYQKLVTGNPDRDLYLLNERIRQVRVTTASGSVVWNLKDARDPQTLKQDLGTTRTVKLTVLSTYGSDRYKDVALSEIAFTEAG
jgi:hypothetical protein